LFQEEEEEEEEEEEVVVVVGMDYLVSLANLGMQVFFVFSGLVVGGDGIFGISCGCGYAIFSVFLR
jgi:hypothetical protein